MAYETSKRSPVPTQLRKRILSRDNHTCQKCGVHRSDNVRLEVDHITPVAEGGTDAEENLQVLCSRCHRRKTRSEIQRGLKRLQALRHPVREQHSGYL